ncbi:MAG: hypothetical protein AAF443_04060 [Chlamydiota bacterium]
MSRYQTQLGFKFFCILFIFLVLPIFSKEALAKIAFEGKFDDFDLKTTKESLIKQIQDKQYAVVPIEVEKEFLDEAIQAYETFLQIPEETKESLNIEIFPDYLRSNCGYQKEVLSKGENTRSYFRYHPRLDLYPLCREAINQHKPVSVLFQKASKLWSVAYDGFSKFFDELDLCHDAVFSKDLSQTRLVLCFIKYSYKNHTEKRSKSHFDGGLMTLSLKETAAGLRIGRSEKTLSPVSHQDGTAILFFGKNIESLLDQDNNLFPGWHDVVPGLGDRYAIIAFIDTLEASGIPKEKTDYNPLNDLF